MRLRQAGARPDVVEIEMPTTSMQPNAQSSVSGRMRTTLLPLVCLIVATPLVAAARPPMTIDDDELLIEDDPLAPRRPIAALKQVARRPPPAVTTHLPDEDKDTEEDDDDDDDHEDDQSRSWRLEGGFGWRFGSFLVNNISTGTVKPGHLDVGLRKGRLLLNTEYQLMGLELPGMAVGTIRGEGSVPLTSGRGLMHRIGGNARYSFGRIGEHDGGADLWVEGGVGLQHFRWDAGGTWTRPDISLGFGGASWGQGDDKHGGLSVGLRINLARRSDAEGAPVACGGPCDMATKPTGWDRSFLFDITLMFGK